MHTSTVINPEINTTNVVEGLSQNIKGGTPSGGLETITLESESHGYYLLAEMEVDTDYAERVWSDWDSEPHYRGGDVRISVSELTVSDEDGDELPLTDDQYDELSEACKEYLR